MWGLGGLTFGLTMRYLGMSLGMGVALGYCAAFGTLMPPIFHGEFVSKVLGTTSGQVILIGVVDLPARGSPSPAWPACRKSARCPRSRRERPSRSSTS